MNLSTPNENCYLSQTSYKILCILSTIKTGVSSKSSDGSLTTVREESDVYSGNVVLNLIEGVESWTGGSHHLIFPAVVAMCKPEVFQTFQLKNSSVSDRDNVNLNVDVSKIRFGSVSLGSTQAARTGKNMAEKDLKWRRAHFEIRQNYLLEYHDDGGSTGTATIEPRPQGYAFLQGAKSRPHKKFENTLELEFSLHPRSKTRCLVSIFT